MAFRDALCDSFNTPDALRILRELVSRTNVYINSRGKALNVSVVEQSARWVGQMLRMFGLGEGEREELGWGTEQEGGGGGVNVCSSSSTIIMSLTSGDSEMKSFCLTFEFSPRLGMESAD